MQIVVSLNYRVAAGGFLYSKEVAAEGSQNLGLYDQVKYLVPFLSFRLYLTLYLGFRSGSRSSGSTRMWSPLVATQIK